MLRLLRSDSLRQLLTLIVIALVVAVLADPRAAISASIAVARAAISGPAGQQAAQSHADAGQQPQAPQMVTASFTNSTPIAIPAAATASPSPATPFPSTINVTGVGTTLSAVTVTFNGFHHTQQKDLDVLLVGPTGLNLVLMSDNGGAISGSTIIDLTIADSAATTLPTTMIAASGTYKPTNNNSPDTGDNFQPGVAPPYNSPQPTGVATLGSFVGSNPNGDWKLYVYDDVGGDIGAFNGGWTINITTAAAAVGTTTTVSSSLNPSLTTNSPSFTAHVVKTSDSTNVTVGTVTFVDSSTGATLASNVSLNGSGLASTPAISGLIERRHTITANYNGDPAFLTSSGSMFQTVDFPTTNPSTGVYANTNSVTIPDPVASTGPGGAVQFPSHITISGMSGIISNISVSLKNITHSATGDMDILLVGPGGQNIILMSDSGGSNTNITVNLDDGAASTIGPSGSWGAAGSTVASKPFDYTAGDSWPTPAPASGYNSPSPIGSATLNNIFGATSPNGIWSLYIYDDAGGNSGTMAGGWSLTFTVTSSLTWNGGTNANWDTPANWTPAVMPSSLLDAVIPASGVTNEPTISASNVSVSNLTVAAGRTLTVNSGRTLTVAGTTTVNGSFAGSGGIFVFNNLTIGNAAGVTLGGNATVSGALALTTGDLNLGANTLTQPNTGSSSGAFDVIGNVRRTGFASGGAALSFGNPLNTIRINSGAAPADITVRLAKSAPTGFSSAVQRTYTITPNGANGPATLRLHYLDSELNGNTPESNLRLKRFNGTGWAPVAVTNSSTAGINDNWLENNAVTTFSPWTFSTFAPTAAHGVISGRITTNDGKPVAGAVVYLSGGQTRKLITDTNGAYRFENVVTGDFYTVTPARANYNFNPFNRSFSQNGNETESIFSAQSLGDSVNPLDTAEYFVRQQYLDILGREPDEAGFNYWSDQLLGCLSELPAGRGPQSGSLMGVEDAGGPTAAECTRVQRTNIAAAFFMSAENQESGLYLYDVYAGSLGRRPALGEFTADRGQVVGGDNLDAAKTTFAQTFVQRAEFMTKYPATMTAEEFVAALIQSAASSGGNLSSLNDGRANLISLYGQTADPAISRAAVLRSLADNVAFKQTQYNQAFVLTEYFAYLQRGAEPDGFNFWVNVLSTGDPGNYRGMVCSFVTSAEYQHRFSRIVSHSNSECSGQ